MPKYIFGHTFFLIVKSILFSEQLYYFVNINNNIISVFLNNLVGVFSVTENVYRHIFSKRIHERDEKLIILTLKSILETIFSHLLYHETISTDDYKTLKFLLISFFFKKIYKVGKYTGKIQFFH